MTNKNNYDNLKNSLLKGTDEATKMKADIWNKIEAKLDGEERTVNKVRKNNKQKNRLALATVAASIVLAITLTTTETGSAFLSHVKDLFAPEKIVVEEVEGIQEETHVTLQEGKAGYILYIDEENYRLVEVDGKERVVTKQELGDLYPDVYMEIEQVEEIDPRTMADQLYAGVKKEFKTTFELEIVDEPLEGFNIHAINGSGGLEWNDPVINYYIVSNGKEGAFIIRQHYFLEASEGHGARFDQMLKDFTILDEIEGE